MATTATEPSVRKLSAALGAEIEGIDLGDVSDANVEWIIRMLTDHAVLVFRGQQLEAADIAALGRKMGVPRPHILLKYRVPDHPEVSFITNVDANGKVDPFGVTRAAVWHTDASYKDELPHLAMLHSVQVPSKKGGTMFCDMRAAYDTLPSDTKARLDNMIAIHGTATGPQGYRRGTRGLDAAHAAGQSEARHPAVRVHPLSGRRVLFVNPMHTMGFEGVPDDEATRLIEELAAHSIRDEFVYYHQWKKGDVVMWDETSTMHKNAGDYDPSEPRVFLRTIVYPA